MYFKQAHSSNFRVGRTSSIKYLVIHFTSNDGDTAKNNVDYYSRTANLKASAHYYIDKSNEIWQSVKEGDTAYHCGATKYKHKYCRNSNSIGIELCSRYRGNLKEDKKLNKVDFTKYYFEDAVILNAVKFTKELMAKYNIPIENVIRHYDVTGKTCPAPMVINNGLWNKFKAMLTETGDLTMSQYNELKNENESLKKEIQGLKTANETLIKEVEKLKSKQEKVYHYTVDVPEYARPTIQKLLDKGYYKGESKSELNLPETLMRTLVINDRAGLYK